MESLTGFLHEVTTLLCGVPLPKNSLILPMPIATHWDQHFLLQEYQVWLHSTLFNHLVSFLVVSESRHGTNPAKLKPNTAFLLFSHVLSNTKCTALLCLLQQQAQPREGSNKDLQNEQLNMNYRCSHSSKDKQNNTIPGAVLRSTFSLLYYTPATPRFCEVGIHLFFSLMLPSPLHLKGQRTCTHSITWTVPLKLPFPERPSALPNITIIPEYSLWFWPAAYPSLFQGVE